ncbi:MAG TPA: hypothetical protein PKC43_04575 [Phycisphaerales bacterium]|nr:hypothetical protein [Phycisphaerales bacterium]HMP36702.1 hypothetical protein [Phycisphaerales bacterium]
MPGTQSGERGAGRGRPGKPKGREPDGAVVPTTGSASESAAALLFTAFEPSGDALAAPVIAALLERRPGLKIYAVGGPKMEAAGAAIVERTDEGAAMGLGALSKAFAVAATTRRLRRWSKHYRVLCHVAVDSPAANFPIARIMHRAGARVVHLAAPQLWAWGGWRIGKLRRLTSLVLCLLPFERRWFAERDVPARFIGHPAMSRPLDETALERRAAALPRGAPKVVLLPGSRPGEVRANMGLLGRAYIELQGRHGGMAGVVVAASPAMGELVRRALPVFPNGLHMISGSAVTDGISGLDAAIRWADLALAVSGTVTLDLTRQRTPMVGLYRTGVISWLGAKVLLRTPWRLLPNIIARRAIVPEFVPHVGGAGPIIEAAAHLMRDSRNLAQQSDELARIAQAYEGRDPGNEAAEAILEVLGAAGAAAPATAAPAKPAELPR